MIASDIVFKNITDSNTGMEITAQNTPENKPLFAFDRAFIHTITGLEQSPNYKGLCYNSVYYGFSFIREQKRGSDRVNIEELKKRIVQKIPVFFRKNLQTVVRRVR